MEQLLAAAGQAKGGTSPGAQAPPSRASRGRGGLPKPPDIRLKVEIPVSAMQSMMAPPAGGAKPGQAAATAAAMQALQPPGSYVPPGGEGAE